MFSSLESDVHVNRTVASLTCCFICNGLLLILVKHAVSTQLEIIFLERKAKYSEEQGIECASSIAHQAFLDAFNIHFLYKPLSSFQLQLPIILLCVSYVFSLIMAQS